MDTTINILHLSDAHIDEKNKNDVERRVDSLTQYLLNERIEVDLVAFTGDLTFSGAAEEFDLFEQFVSEPIRKRLKINDHRFLIIPGNHDVVRTKVTMDEHGKCRKLSGSRDAEGVLRAMKCPWKRLEDYIAYQQKHTPAQSTEYEYKEYCSGIFNTRKIDIKGIRIGVACLNSAWLCDGDEDRHALFLTEFQIEEAKKSLNGCDLKIAMCHHPYDWYHPSEVDLSWQDLRREFQLILTGHLHKAISVNDTDTVASSLSMTVRALFDGKIKADIEDGFHIYQMSVSGGKLKAMFRKYMRRRNTFDKDTEHAQDGQHEFILPVPLSLQNSSALLVQKLALDSTIISKEIHSALCLLQSTEHPVFVTPKIRSFKCKDGVRLTVRPKLALEDLMKKNVVLCGGRDSGKTILLKTIATQSDRLNNASLRKSATVYLSASDVPKHPTEDAIMAILMHRLDSSIPEIVGVSITLVIDGVGARENDFVETLSFLCKKHQWHYVLSLSSLVADVLAQNAEHENTLFVEILPWGPSRIREFAVKLFADTDVDADLAYKLVTECLRSVDLPATPTVISLYMSVFPKIGAEISSLTFLRLLEKIEQMRLGSGEIGTVDSFYNRRKFLQVLAIAFLRANSSSKGRHEVESMIGEYFTPKNLAIDPAYFLDTLIRCGMLQSEQNRITFAHFVFFDYYLALGFKERMLSDNEFTGDIPKCDHVVHALSLFAGLDRENLSMAQRILETIERTCRATGDLQLNDLDAHITYALVPASSDPAEADLIARESLEEKVDYEALDEGYEHQRRQVAGTRAKLLEGGIDDSVDELELQIKGLHSFYSIFRNLENIEGDWKALLLDRILDFHINTNFFLIDFHFRFSKSEAFRSFAAYMLTCAGHAFMAESLRNPTMCASICQLLDSTKNDFKKLLLLLLLSELNGPTSLQRIQEFIQQTKSRSAIEIFCMHIRNKLVEHKKIKFPRRLVELFKEIYIKRQLTYGGFQKISDVNRTYSEAMEEIKREHWSNYRENSFAADSVPEDGAIDV